MAPELDPLLPYRLKTVRIGIQVTGLALAALMAYRVLPGHGPLPDGPFYVLAGAAILAGIVVLLLPWPRLLASPRGVWWMYAWSLVDIALISFAIGFNGGANSPLFFLYVFTTSFFALSYPIRAQAALLAVTLLSYLLACFATGTHDQAAPLFFRSAGLGILGLLGAFGSREMMQQMSGHHEAMLESDRRADLLATVASAAHPMSATNTDEVVAAVVRAAVALGFPLVGVCSFDGDHFEVIHSAGLPASMAGRSIPSSSGIVGRVRESRQTLVEDEYPSQPWAISHLVDAGVHSAIASPIWAGGEIVAALVGGSTDRRVLSPQEIEAFELLAAQAGAALHIAQRFEEERRTVERLAELDRMKGDFLTSVSHELRTPLTVIVGNGKTLSSSWATLGEPLKLELLGRLNANAKALEGIITTLLDVSRLEAGHVGVDLEAFDLRALLDAAVARLAPLFEEHTLVTDSPDRVMVMADPTLIDRVIENLLANAVKHTPPGTRVEVTIGVDDERARVMVADDGDGIAPQDLVHIGERFFRGGDPVARRARGTGLGLAFSREVLQLHGSGLTVESEPGQGARFSFELPMTDHLAEQPAAAPAAASAAERT